MSDLEHVEGNFHPKQTVACFQASGTLESLYSIRPIIQFSILTVPFQLS